MLVKKNIFYNRMKKNILSFLTVNYRDGFFDLCRGCDQRMYLHAQAQCRQLKLRLRSFLECVGPACALLLTI